MHRLAAASLPAGHYRRVDVGDVEGAVLALQSLENDVARERSHEVSWIGEPKSGACGESVIEARPATSACDQVSREWRP